MDVIRVLVVDDHELVRKGITRMLNDEKGIEVLAEASTGEQAIVLARQLQPDVVLMDVKMPGIGGIEATRKIVKALPGVQVLALSVYEEEPFPSRLLKAGAAGFLSKGAELDEMLRAIRAVKSGQRYLSAEMVLALSINSDLEKSPFEKLSQRELQITMMVANCQKVAEISEVLSLSPKTVNTYRYRVFEKLKVANDVELAHLASKHGLLEQEPDLN
jgi:DNA-binding NarL/FixJ family response regulator